MKSLKGLKERLSMEQDHPPELLPLIERVQFRIVRPTDIPECAKLEKASYPDDEAASKSTLQYRQHHAARFFRCAVLGEEDDHDLVIGYICSTRCRQFEHESMATHIPDGPILAIHSVVVGDEYRHQGIATAMMLNYVQEMKQMNQEGVIVPIEKIVLLAKKDMLTFYIHCGFQVVRPSHIVHGKELWYELEIKLGPSIRPGIPCYIVDAFADPEQTGTGNQAAIVLLQDADLTDEVQQEWMRRVAQEFNLSETAFLVPKTDVEAVNRKEIHYSIRYFTPSVEVPLCGHATLASAAILYQTVDMKNKNETTVVFHAREDFLSVDLTSSNGRCTTVAMRFPVKPALPLESEEDIRQAKEMLESALEVDPDSVSFVGLSEIGDVLIEISFESFLEIGYEGLNYEAFLQWDGYSRGVIICCVAPPKPMDDEEQKERLPIDFLSRFFSPKAGINEDPVTGSAHCVLAPYYCSKLKKDKIIGMQMSRRGGIIECQLDGETVRISGTAVTAVSGTLWL